MITPNFHSYKDIVYDIIGAAMEVHRQIGHGLLEPIYNEALHIELNSIGINHTQEQRILCYYKGIALDKYYQADIATDDVILELKSVSEINSQHRKQLLNYLRLTKKPIGLLINFGQPSLQTNRIGCDTTTNKCYLLDSNMNILYNQNRFSSNSH